MVSGFPYPVPAGTIPSQKRVPKTKFRPPSKPHRVVKESVKREEDDSDDDEDEDEALPRDGGLGFSA